MKNRTFWFADYEGLRDLEGVPRVRQVPTAAEKAGLFSAAVVDPFARGATRVQPQRPGSVGDPARALGSGRRRDRRAHPDPNVPGSTIYASTPVTDTRQDQFDVRIDHQISAKLTLFGRYSFVDTLTFRPAPLPGLGEGSFNDAFGVERQPLAGPGARPDVDGLAEPGRRLPVRLLARQLLHDSAQLRRRWRGGRSA